MDFSNENWKVTENICGEKKKLKMDLKQFQNNLKWIKINSIT